LVFESVPLEYPIFFKISIQLRQKFLRNLGGQANKNSPKTGFFNWEEGGKKKTSCLLLPPSIE